MSDNGDIVEVTAPVELAIVDDRLHATVVSGSYRRTYALSFHKARNAAQAAAALLDQHDRKQSNVRRIGKRKREHN